MKLLVRGRKKKKGKGEKQSFQRSIEEGHNYLQATFTLTNYVK
jgi:hypothetical protein